MYDTCREFVSLSLDAPNYELHKFANSFYMYGDTTNRWGLRERHATRSRFERERVR